MPWCGCCCTPPSLSGCCSSSRTSTGLTSRRCCCFGSSCAAAPDRPCWSSRPTATWRRRPPARWLACSPTSDGRLAWRRSASAACGRSETAALVAAHLGRESVDGASAQRLFDQTGGNPFFIEELLHSPAAAPAAAAVPEGVKDVIGRRLDRLPAATLEALTLAAVLGSDFRLATLQVVAVERHRRTSSRRSRLRWRPG